MRVWCVVCVWCGDCGVCVVVCVVVVCVCCVWCVWWCVVLWCGRLVLHEVVVVGLITCEGVGFVRRPHLFFGRVHSVAAVLVEVGGR